MTLPHTEVDPGVGGQGIGTALVAGVLDAARERGLHVLPYCSFIRHYIQQHPETVDLVAEDDRPHFGLEIVAR
jgi:predicted GNAT family acetyltransferase